MSEVGGESSLSQQEALELAFDPRLADVWAAIFQCQQSQVEASELPEHIGWFLRMAYLKGYEDALSEPDPGSLFRNLGAKPPMRRTTGQRQRRRSR